MEPRVAKSKMDKEDPSLALAHKESCEPSRLKLRRDNEDPKCWQSKIDKVDPSR